MTCPCCAGLRHPAGATSRRGLMRLAAAGFAAAALPPAAAWAADPNPPAGRGLTPDQALDLLRRGNDEFIHEAPFHSEVGRQRRIEIAREQHPIAVLVSCSDSRVPPELLFGRGLGELFIVRNAGNTVDTAALGSVEYAVEHLGVPLVMVLGHERCGAVQAAVSVVKENARFHGAIGEMIEPIIPAVLEAQAQGGDLLDGAVRANVRRVVERLRQAGPVIQGPLASGKLKIVGARYDLDDGDVDFAVA